MSSKVASMLLEAQKLIDTKSNYEAHQLILARARRAKTLDDSVALLEQGARLLIESGRFDSGIDIGVNLVTLLEKRRAKPTEAYENVLIGLLRQIPITMPAASKLVDKAVGWSIKFGEYPAGSPALQDAIGDLYANASEVYKAESHLLVGSEASIEPLARLEFEWYLEDAPASAGTYAGRIVLPYLHLGNPRFALLGLEKFIALIPSRPDAPAAAAGFGTPGPTIFPDMPVLNFLSLLVHTVGRGSPQSFVKLRSHYASALAATAETEAWESHLDQIGEVYCGIRKPVQSNPLFDIMGSLLGGQGGLGGGNQRLPFGGGLD